MMLLDFFLIVIKTAFVSSRLVVDISSKFWSVTLLRLLRWLVPRTPSHSSSRGTRTDLIVLVAGIREARCNLGGPCPAVLLSSALKPC